MTIAAHSQKAATEVRVPAEWEPHDACWLAYPYLEHEWPDHLEGARHEVVELCRAIGESERVELLVPAGDTQLELEEALAGTRVRFHQVPYGDIWTRDTGPIFTERAGSLGAACFRFNGWGGKYVFAGDTELAVTIAQLAGAQVERAALVIEGGALEVDGNGTAITTRQCLLDDKRNPGASESDIEHVLHKSLGIERVIWLERGLANDHTDGHVDTLARFVGPATVACAVPGDGDPNTDALVDIRSALAAATDASDNQLRIIDVPSPGAITGADGELLCASYLNFYIANRCIVVPSYGVANDDEALAAIAAMFPERRAIGLSARAILTGGGAIHCSTKHQPRLTR